MLSHCFNDRMFHRSALSFVTNKKHWYENMGFFCFLRGVNVVPFLEMIGLPESLVGLLRDSSSGYALTAYAMYKVN